ncbi:hypothetical protein D1631_13400 [Chryseobacterium nematophagum]|uniref:Uncharacterized protein n=1 Tax=Chryseobacterium nematophagum TaxID=2305228 RepID=A0A3M7TIV8_9FLAO|nr:hypothetical protein [Chryseobacterium nematophagum]RNA62857.1 hypothetical protein D1631_13400 [Chryseobacterium nematophagum]
MKNQLIDIDTAFDKEKYVKVILDLYCIKEKLKVVAYESYDLENIIHLKSIEKNMQEGEKELGQIFQVSISDHAEFPY